MLDAQKLQKYRVVITNYETVKNYQHSFAQTVNGIPIWSIVVTDEAQEYKTPNTKISHAVKTLQPDVYVACTGTPVENRLLDIWNIMDCIQPALLGTSKSFSSTYEGPLETSQADAVLPGLRERLLFGQPNAFVVRRDKRALSDLPNKLEARLVCELSSSDVEAHLALLSNLRSEKQRNAHLAIIHRLSQLYQHPSLANESWRQKPPSDLIRESAKLRVVVDELRKICHRREKAIIFARLVAVQQLLAVVLSEAFDLNVQIINGSTARAAGERSSATTKRAKDTRSKILADFKSKPGFNVVVLSPFVAGVGLTITEANHVFHYGRWWNPATEAQATDRAYRIGQEKDVTVYFPILRDPTGRVAPSFDECLDELLRKRSRLASDFLRPIETEEANVDELCSDLLGGDGDQHAPGLHPLDRAEIDRLSPSDFEALVACLYDADGFGTVLTCQSNDAGADVVAVKEREAWLLQAKHSSANVPVTREAVDDVLAAQTVYQNALGRSFRLAVISNSRYSSECVERARDCGVVLLGSRDLGIACQTHRPSLGDVVAKAESRARSFGECIASARRLLGTVRG